MFATKKKKKKLLCAFVCVFLGSKAVAEISSFESLLALCVGLSLFLYVCVCLRETFAGVPMWKIQDS